MHFSKIFTTMAATAAGAAVIGLSTSGCGSHEPEQALQGPTTQTVLPISGTPVTEMTVQGNTLKPGINYTFNNVSVTIDGDLPDGVTITGNNGQLLVKDNTGDHDTLHVNVPENTQLVPETCTGINEVLIGFTTIGTTQIPNYMPVPYDYDCSHTDDIGPKAPFDKDAAIIIKGKTGKMTSLSGSAGVKILQLG